MPAELLKSPSEEVKTKKTQKSPPPLIAAYFSDPEISPSAFLKVLKSEKIKRFNKEDEEKAHKLLVSNDPNGTRLWSLMSQSKLPDPVDRWIWLAAQDRLRFAIGSKFDPHDPDKTRILKTLRDALLPDLKSKDKNERKNAENWLRIGVCWLAEKRSMQLWSIAEIIFPAFFREQKGASLVVSRAIRKGRTNELKLAVATTSLGKEMVAKAKSDRDVEKRVADNLRVQLSEAKSRTERLNAELKAARIELEKKSDALITVRTQLENERHHWGHDLSETKAEQRVLLVERLVPLLSDAIDALEIEPPVPHVAIKRLKAVLSMIDDKAKP
jgi:hypothetical protein